ncbi:hypothetical protein STBA_32350 [Streptomyces sp. MP131-18]|nr:hypothetical protein STBA_32350 [Streptomyces sp. MP131-18]
MPLRSDRSAHGVAVNAPRPHALRAPLRLAPAGVDRTPQPAGHQEAGSVAERVMAARAGCDGWGPQLSGAGVVSVSPVRHRAS